MLARGVRRHNGPPGPAGYIDDRFGGRSVREAFDYDETWSLPSTADRAAISAIMAGSEALA